MININEKFISIQGEGPCMGDPSVFIRFSGCLLNCSFCDTKYAWKLKDEEEKLEPKTLIPMMDYISNCKTKNVVFTGGEPLMYYKDETLQVLLHSLIKQDYDVTFETTFLTDVHVIKESVFAEVYYELMAAWGEEVVRQCRFVISPKLDIKAYPIDVTINEIINYYTLDIEACYNLSYWGNIFYKLIYDIKYKEDILKLINYMPDWWTEDYLFMMPMTPIPLKNKRTEYQKSCELTTEFCIQNGLQYSPRIHIDIWGDKEGV